LFFGWVQSFYVYRNLKFVIWKIWAAPGAREIEKAGGAKPPTFLESFPSRRGPPDPRKVKKRGPDNTMRKRVAGGKVRERGLDRKMRERGPDRKVRERDLDPKVKKICPDRNLGE
jgi:hypothetical protein